MSLYDPYRELELYLEQAKDEITQVFEQQKYTTTVDTSNYDGEIRSIENENQSTDCDSDHILSHFNAIINSDIKELFARYGQNYNDNVEYLYENDKNDLNDAFNLPPAEEGLFNSLSNSNYSISGIEDVKEDGFLRGSLIIEELNGSRSTLNLTESVQVVANENQSYIPINTATQTSPSLSHSSTNLTWTSGCSSPCLTSASEVDGTEISDDDTNSTSSADGMVIKHGQWQKELNAKSSSTPVLKKVVAKVNEQQFRSQSDRHLAEIEATEACKWLRAAGFPQYAQMYEDLQFPVDVLAAAQDHPLLEPAVLHSLFRRLQILNRCARVHQRVTHTDDSEDEQCALSANWTYQSDSRRWSRNMQTIQLPNVQEATSKEWWCDSSHHEKDEVFDEKSRCNPKERLRRAGSTKYRRRRDGMVINDNSSNVLDILSKQLDNFNTSSSTSNASCVSDSECTTSLNRRRRTRSVDKTDTWSHPPNTTDSIFWQTFQKSKNVNEEYTSLNLENLKGGRPVVTLSCTQLQVLRKLALLKLTAHMEKYCPTHRSTGWNLELPKFIRKIKTPIYREKMVFGVPLTVNVQRTGQPLPKCIEEALVWLQQNATDQIGIFRKPGVKSRIQTLRNMVEIQRENLIFTEQQAYDVADMVKQYFRELPEALLTNKFSETFILIFQHIPPFLRREAVLCGLLLLPDEHVQVLQVVLNFLSNIAQNASVNQMNESNLAMCFAPSLFHYSQVSSRQGFGSPHPKELAENKAAHECLSFLLKNSSNLFNIPRELINQCKTGEMRDTKPVHLSELGADLGGWRRYLHECQVGLLKEAREKSRGWIIISSHNPKVEVAYKKVADGHPLRLWRICAEIEAPPLEVLHRLLRERHIWDHDLQSTRTIAQVDKNCEIFQYVRRNLISLPNEEYCVLRSWKTDLPKDACLIVETSVEHQDALAIPNSVRGIVLASRYLIEPCGSGRARILHLSRVDTRGRMSEWYHKNYGHICAIYVSNILNSFRQTAVGPESKV